MYTDLAKHGHLQLLVSLHIYFLSSLFKFEEYVVTDAIALMRDAVGKKLVLFLPAGNMRMRNKSLRNVNIGTGLVIHY